MEVQKSDYISWCPYVTGLYYIYYGFDEWTGAYYSNTGMTSVNDSLDTHIICTCGRKCNGRRGLKTHQRSCQVHRMLSTEYVDPVPINSDVNHGSTGGGEEVTHDINMASGYFDDSTKFQNKPGLILPKTPGRWKEANAYFHAHLNIPQNIDDIDAFVEETQQKVYDYFAAEYGTVPSVSDLDYLEKYSNLSTKSLKSALHKLKINNANVEEMLASW